MVLKCFYHHFFLTSWRLELIVWPSVNFGCFLCPLSISLILSYSIWWLSEVRKYSTIRHGLKAVERRENVVVWYTGFNKLSSCSCEVKKSWAWMHEGRSAPSVRDRLFRSGYPHARHVVGNGGKNSADNPFILLSRVGNDRALRLPGSSVSFTVVEQIAYHVFVWFCNMFEWRCKTGFRCRSLLDCLLHIYRSWKRFSTPTTCVQWCLLLLYRNQTNSIYNLLQRHCSHKDVYFFLVSTYKMTQRQEDIQLNGRF